MKRRTALLWLLLLVALGGLWYVRQDETGLTPQQRLEELRVQRANGWIDERLLLERLAALLRDARRANAERFEREVRLERARVLLSVGASEEASRELLALLEEAPEDRARLLRLLVRADVAAGELDRALRRLDELAEVQPDTPEAWVETGQLLVQRARATVEERMRALEYKLTRDEARRARALVDRLLAQDEADPGRAATMNEFRELFLASEEGEVAEMLGAADRASSDVRRARRAFARSVALGLDPQAVGGLVRILYDAGERRLALQVGQLTSANAGVRRDRETTRALLAAMLELDHYTAAGELAREWVLSTDRPMDREFLRLACEALYRAELWGPLTVATNKLRSVGARDDFLGAMAYLGIAQVEQDMTDKARLSLERFTRNRVAEPLPGIRARAWFELAQIARAEGADAREREALTGALEAAPDSAGEHWLRLSELQQEAPHLGYRVPLQSLGIAMCRSPERTEELLVRWRALGEAATRAEGRDVEQVYLNLLTQERTVPRLDLGPYVLYRVAELYAADANWHGALANLRRVFDELPGFLPAVDLAIRCELELGRAREANERIVERFELIGGDEASLAWLDETGTTGLTPSQVVRLVRADPEHSGRLLVSIDLQGRGRLEEALAALQITPVGQRSDADLLREGEILLALGRPEEALVPLARIDPEWVRGDRARRALLDAALQTGKLARARGVVDELLAAIDSGTAPGRPELVGVADRLLRADQGAWADELLARLETAGDGGSGAVLLRRALAQRLAGDAAGAGLQVDRAEAFLPGAEVPLTRLLIAGLGEDELALEAAARRLRAHGVGEGTPQSALLRLAEGAAEEALAAVEAHRRALAGPQEPQQPRQDDAAQAAPEEARRADERGGAALADAAGRDAAGADGAPEKGGGAAERDGAPAPAAAPPVARAAASDSEEEALLWSLAECAARWSLGQDFPCPPRFGGDAQETVHFLVGSRERPRHPGRAAALLLAADVPLLAPGIEALLGRDLALGELWPALLRARLQRDGGRHASARRSFERLTSQHPGFVPAWSAWLELERRARGDAAPVLEELQRRLRLAAAQADPEGADAALEQSLAFRRRDKLDHAIALCRKALLIEPGRADALVLMARAQELNGQLDAALTTWRELCLERPPTDARLYVREYLAALRTGRATRPPRLTRADLDERLRELAEALPLDPLVVLMRAELDLDLERANPTVGLRRARARLAAFREQLGARGLDQLQPGSCAAWAGFLLELDPDLGVEFLEEETRRTPGSIDTWILLVRALRAADRSDEALDLAERLARMAPDARIQLEVGAVLAERGADARELEELFERAGKRLAGVGAALEGDDELRSRLMVADAWLATARTQDAQRAAANLRAGWASRQRIEDPQLRARLGETYARALVSARRGNWPEQVLRVLEATVPHEQDPYRRTMLELLGGLCRFELARRETREERRQPRPGEGAADDAGVAEDADDDGSAGEPSDETDAAGDDGSADEPSGDDGAASAGAGAE